MYQKNHLTNNERGFASVTVALTLIIVLALLTVGFAQLARREQQDALRKQLAVQANYAAESGINDAYKLVQAAANNPAATPSLADLDKPNQCLPDSILTNKNLGSITSGVSYSCVIVDLHPPSLLFTGVSPSDGQYVSFTTSAALSKVTIAWRSSKGNTNFRNSIADKFSPYADATNPTKNWSSPAVLQFGLTALGPTFNRTSLINNTATAYLYPATPGAGLVHASDLTNGGGQTGKVTSGGCNTANGQYPCSVTMDALPGSADNSYLIHFVDYYDASDISITGVDASGSQVKFSGQALIDSTGKARDVLKRLQVRLPLGNSTIGLPDYAADAQNLCKRIQTAPYDTEYVNPDGSIVNPLNVYNNRGVPFNPCDLGYVNFAGGDTGP